MVSEAATDLYLYEIMVTGISVEASGVWSTYYPNNILKPDITKHSGFWSTTSLMPWVAVDLDQETRIMSVWVAKLGAGYSSKTAPTTIKIIIFQVKLWAILNFIV